MQLFFDEKSTITAQIRGGVPCPPPGWSVIFCRVVRNAYGYVVFLLFVTVDVLADFQDLKTVADADPVPFW